MYLVEGYRGSWFCFVFLLEVGMMNQTASGSPPVPPSTPTLQTLGFFFFFLVCLFVLFAW